MNLVVPSSGTVSFGHAGLASLSGSLRQLSRWVGASPPIPLSRVAHV